MRPPIIVFDLDGTLIDTAPDLIDSLNHALSGDGFGAVDQAQIGAHVGRGGRAMIERVFALSQRRFDPEIVERHHEVFVEHYAAGIPGRSRPYPGVLEAIARAKEAGYVFAICTNKPEGMAVSLVERLGLSDLFGAICGGDTFAFRKPDPRHLTETIERAGGDPCRARDGWGFAHRHRHGEGGGHPGGGGGFRLHGPACAGIRAERGDFAFRRADGGDGGEADRGGG